VSHDANDGRAVARAASARGQGVIACGGDGTIAGLAGVVSETGGVLALVPTGAGNDLARQVGIGHRLPLAALDLLTNGRVATVDLARVVADGATAWCTTVANTGFDAEANRWANGVTVVTGTPLYVAAVLRTTARYHPEPISIRVDELTWSGKAWLVAVGNTRSYGGGMMITPAAEIDDGLLDVCVITDVPRARFLTRFPSVFRGTHTQVEGVDMYRGARIELRSDAASIPLEIWASGERVGALPASIEVVPRALQLLVPREARVTSA
jgi:diacylglycerol kinase (ATP)